MAEDKKKKGGVHPVGAALVGAAVGAAVTAGAVALSDEKTRKKVAKSVTGLKNKAKDTFTQAKGKIDEMRTAGEKRFKEIRDDFKK